MVDYDRAALCFETGRTQHFAVLERDEQGSLVDIIEKPTPEQIQKVAGAEGRVGVSMNLFRFSYDMILPFLHDVPLHPVRMEKELPAAVMMMVEEFPGSMKAIPRAEHVPDLTSAQDIIIVEELLRKEFHGLTW
jgi:hypothetical protein